VVVVIRLLRRKKKFSAPHFSVVPTQFMMELGAQPCMLGSKSKSLATAICKLCDVNILAAMPRETEPKDLSRS